MRTSIFGFEGYINGRGEICHKTVIIGYKKDEGKGEDKEAKK